VVRRTQRKVEWADGQADQALGPAGTPSGTQGGPSRGEAASEVAMTPLYTSLEKGRPYVLSTLRIVVALLFLEHGLQKYVGFPSAGPPMTTLLYVQGVIEIVGGILLLIGAYTRVVGFILAGDMAAAYFMAHLPRSFFPAVNGGDAAVLFCFAFFYIFFAGGGPWSVDRALLKQD
jgi:putative oxidoreductase